MDSESGGREGLPVRASEAFATIVAALGAEQIVQGALSSFHRLPWDTCRSEKVGLIALMIASIVTAVRFYHGNTLYLAGTYPQWQHNHLPEGAKVPLPVSHAIDVFAHLLEYAVLVGIGISLDSAVDGQTADSTTPAVEFTSAYLWHAALLVVDVLWIFLTLSLRGNDLDAEARTAQKRWALINVAMTVVFIGLVVATRNDWLWSKITNVDVCWIFSSLLIVAAFADYMSSYQFYFRDRTPAGFVAARQAQRVINYTGEALLAERTVPNGKDEIVKWLRDILAYFLDNNANRVTMFERNKRARLHVAIYAYAPTVSGLVPVIRFHDAGVNITNARYFLGTSYVGSAFTRFLENPQAAGVVYERPDIRNEVDENNNPKNYSSYRSGIHSPLRTKDGQLFGTLVATASEEGYFVEALHLPMFSMLARKISLMIVAVAADASPADFLLKTFLEPAVVSVGEKQ